jgi:hypothetical protein
MNDEDLAVAWFVLDPSDAERRRVHTQVFTGVEAHDTSLTAEWLDLFTTAPLASLGLVAASVVAVLISSPLLWLVRVLI